MFGIELPHPARLGLVFETGEGIVMTQLEAARAITSVSGALFLSGAIALYGIYQLVFFCRKVWKLRSELERINIRLAQLPDKASFCEMFEDFNLWTTQNRVMGSAWQEFCDSLIRPGPTEPQSLRNPHESSYYFNESSIIHPRLNLAYYAQIPSYLTGWGILGTFIGLVAGIYLAAQGLGSDDEKQLRAALMSLLGGAATAFLTSVVGLSLSILFSKVEKISVHGLQQRLDLFNERLEERLDLVTLEGLSAQILRSQESSREQLTLFNDQLAFKIASALDEKFSSKLNESLERLVESVGQLRTDRRETDQGMLQGIVEEFRKTMQSSAGTQMNSLAVTLGELGKTLSRTSQLMEGQQALVQESSSRLASELEESMRFSKEALSEGIRNLVGEVTARFASTSDAGADSIRAAGIESVDGMNKMISILDQVTSRFERSVELLNAGAEKTKAQTAKTEAMLHQLESAAREIAGLQEKIKAAIEPLNATASKISSASDRSAQALLSAQSMSEVMGQNTQELKQSATDLRELWGNHWERYQGVDQSIRALFEQLSQGLTAYTSQVADFHKRLDKETAEAVGKLAGLVSQLSTEGGNIEDTLDDILEALKKLEPGIGRKT